MSRLSRRNFARLAGSLAVARPPLLAQHAPLTAQQVVDRIQKSAGGEWTAKTLDTFKAGDPATVVRGIATTAMATLDVLTRAAKGNANLIVTLGPTFFGQQDVQRDDPVYAGKMDFIRNNGLVVWRFSDHWRARTPDPFAVGLARAMVWTRYQVGADPFRYDLPAGTLASLAETLKTRLNARAGIRVIGDPQTPVRRLAILPGLWPLAAGMKTLADCDVVVGGETREWESIEYAADTVAAGRKKGFIMLGRVLSEDPGMNVCAGWLKTVVPEVPVRWLPAGDPYWRPA